MGTASTLAPRQLMMKEKPRETALFAALMERAAAQISWSDTLFRGRCIIWKVLSLAASSERRIQSPDVRRGAISANFLMFPPLDTTAHCKPRYLMTATASANSG